MLFIARRLFGSGDGRSVSRPAIVIATSGVAVGIMVMILSLAIVLGFKGEIRDKIVGMGGHIQVVNYESLYSSESYPIVISDTLLSELRAVDGVKQVHTFATKAGMLKTDRTFHGIMLRGVSTDYDTTYLSRQMLRGNLRMLTEAKPKGDGGLEVVISRRIADMLEIDLSDNVYSYFFDKNLRVRRFRVSGIYCTNMADLDNNIVFCRQEVVQQLCHWDEDTFSGAEVMVADFDSLEDVSSRVGEKVLHTLDRNGAYFAAPTVTELNPGVFSWLDLLDTNILAIIILMIAVAGVTMISGLLIIILERTQFIGVMKAMGATNRQVRRIFLYFACMIVLRGLLLGNILAAVLIAVQLTTGVIGLDPATYYVSQVPMHVDLALFAVVNVITLIICVLVLIVPSYLVSRIHPATSIRFE